MLYKSYMKLLTRHSESMTSQNDYGLGFGRYSLKIISQYFKEIWDNDMYDDIEISDGVYC